MRRGRRQLQRIAQLRTRTEELQAQLALQLKIEKQPFAEPESVIQRRVKHKEYVKGAP